MPNNCLNPDDTTADTNNGVVLLPERAVLMIRSMSAWAASTALPMVTDFSASCSE